MDKSQNKYYLTIGLEIHAELYTQSKMFCRCANVPLEESSNKNVCPICMAHPGTLPTLNREAIKKMIEIGLYIEADVADFTEWDRKHYFYPDMPKAYQLTQYHYPIVSYGQINNWPLTRIHLEEDTAKSTHDQGDYSLIDFNRAGVPLMELVTEPLTFEDIEIAAKTCSNFARELQLILRTLEASEAEMSKGQMRIEVNLSVSPDKDKYGTKVEVKNINSFKSVEDAVRYEASRHIKLLENEEGEKIVQETRGFEENSRTTISQRKKETANDYRYFPEPDLPKLYLHTLFDLENLKNNLPEKLSVIREELKSIVSINDEYLEILMNNQSIFKYFNEVKKEIKKHQFAETKTKQFLKLATNYICSDILGILQNTENDLVHLPRAEDLVEIVTMLEENALSSRGAKDLLKFMMTEITIDNPEERFAGEASARAIAKERNLLQLNNAEALEEIMGTVITNNPDQWDEVKLGNEKLKQFFVGQAMKESKGSGNPEKLMEILETKLKDN